MSGPAPWGDPHGPGTPNPFARPQQSPPGYTASQPPSGYMPPHPSAHDAPNAIQHPPGAFSAPDQHQSAVPPAPPTPARQRRFGTILPAVIVATVVALVVGVAAGYGGARLAMIPWAGPSGPLAEAPADPSAPMQAVAVADRLLLSTVTIAERSVGGGGTGSGFVLDPDGHIVTNNHVIERAAEDGGRLTVEFADGGRMRATIVGRSAGYDLAVLKVNTNRSLQPIALADSGRVKPGQAVLAVGAPLGLGSTVTAGIVSAVDRPLGVGDDSMTDDGAGVAYINGIQTDAAINPGNSGGPLADANGHVIGVNSAILTLGGSARRGGSIGLGFAIPANQAKIISDEIIEHGYATYPVIEATVESTREGVRLTELGSGGPADQAGLVPGDIVTAVAGKQVSSPTDLIVRIRSHRPGEEVSLDVQGRGAVSVTLGTKVG